MRHDHATESELLRAKLLHVTVQDLADFGHLLKPVAAEMMHVLGTELAATIINAWPGALLAVPMPESSRADGQRRRDELLRVLSRDELLKLCTAWGGQELRVPVLRSLLFAKRQRWLRTTHDALTSGNPPAVKSKTEAVYVMGMQLAAAGLAMTSKHIEMVLDSPDSTDTDTRQTDLFATAH